MILRNYTTANGYTVTILCSPDHPDADDPARQVAAKHGAVSPASILDERAIMRQARIARPLNPVELVRG